MYGICLEQRKNLSDFFQTKGVLLIIAICDNNYVMKLYFGNKIQWRCNLSTCEVSGKVHGLYH